MVDAGEIFHPLRWTPAEATRFLHRLPQLENAGVVVRMPATWRANHPPRPRVTAKVGSARPRGSAWTALLDFRMEVTLDGEPLTAARDPQAAGRDRRAGAGARPVGRGGSGAAGAHDGPVQRGRGARRRRTG